MQPSFAGTQDIGGGTSVGTSHAAMSDEEIVTPTIQRTHSQSPALIDYQKKQLLPCGAVCSAHRRDTYVMRCLVATAAI